MMNGEHLSFLAVEIWQANKDLSVHDCTVKAIQFIQKANELIKQDDEEHEKRVREKAGRMP